MKCLHVSLMLMLMLTTLVSSAADGEKYISKEGKFAIAFPKDSKVKTDTKKTDSEELTFNMVIVDSQGVLYGVVYADVADKELKDIKKFFNSVERGLVRRSGAKVVETKEIEFGPDKLPGRNVLSEKDGTQGRLQMIVKGTRFYAIMLRGSKDLLESKEASAFFDSFEIK